MLSHAAALASGPLRLFARSLRVTTIDAVHLQTLRARRQNFLFVAWHGRILVPILRHRDEGIVAMVSQSVDGDLASRILAGLGFEAVRGSSSRGGKEAFHALVGRLRDGCDGALIPDGPRGPARQLKPGALYLAQQSGVPILPLAASARPARRLGSWDRFLLPAPFARAVIAYGAPVDVPPRLSDDEFEKLRAQLESRLDALAQAADTHLGRIDPPPRNGPNPSVDEPR